MPIEFSKHNKRAHNVTDGNNNCTRSHIFLVFLVDLFTNEKVLNVQAHFVVIKHIIINN